MESNENKKSNTGLIIAIVIIVLLIAFIVWFFLLKGNGTNNDSIKPNDSTPTPTNKTTEYDYRDGVLTTIVDENGNPKQTDFVIDGIILIGNRHSYLDREDAAEIIQHFSEQGYKKEGINSSFYLNEYIGFYIDTKYNGEEDDVRILVVPHKTVDEFEKMSNTDLEALASEKGFVMNYVTPDTNNYKYVNEGYVHIDYPEGKYDILFTYKGKLAYFISINETKEPIE